MANRLSKVMLFLIRSDYYSSPALQCKGYELVGNPGAQTQKRQHIYRAHPAGILNCKKSKGAKQKSEPQTLDPNGSVAASRPRGGRRRHPDRGCLRRCGGPSGRCRGVGSSGDGAAEGRGEGVGGAGGEPHRGELRQLQRRGGRRGGRQRRHLRRLRSLHLRGAPYHRARGARGGPGRGRAAADRAPPGPCRDR